MTGRLVDLERIAEACQRWLREHKEWLDETL
jgi:hypothetical protein